MFGRENFERHRERKTVGAAAFAEIDNPLSADADTAQKGPLRDPIELLAIEYRVVISQQVLLDVARILWGAVQRIFLLKGKPCHEWGVGGNAQHFHETSRTDRVLDT